MKTGREIKAYLEENGISQTFLSKKTGIELPKLNLALNGNRRLTFDEYEIICWALNIDTDKFLRPHEPSISAGGKNMTELKSIATCELVKELKKREGVEMHIAEPYKDLSVTVNGPAVVLVVTD